MAKRRQCDHCKKEYEARRPRSRFCSAACRVAAHRAYMANILPLKPREIHSAIANYCLPSTALNILFPLRWDRVTDLPKDLQTKVEFAPDSTYDAARIDLCLDEPPQWIEADKCEHTPPDSGLSAFQLAMRRKKLGY